MIVDTSPFEVRENSWNFEILADEISLSGLCGLEPDRGSYLVRRPAGAPEHKVPELLQRVLSAARNIAEAEALLPSLGGLSSLFECAWGLQGIMSEAKFKIPAGLDKKQLTTSSLTRSATPCDPSLDKALKLQFEVNNPGILRIHAQELRSFVRNCMCLAVHGGVFRNWSFDLCHRTDMDLEQDKMSDSKNLPVFLADDSELSDLLRTLYFQPRFLSGSSEVQIVSVDLRVSSFENGYSLRGEIASSERLVLMNRILSQSRVQEPTDCSVSVIGFRDRKLLSLRRLMHSKAFRFACLLEYPRLARTPWTCI